MKYYGLCPFSNVETHLILAQLQPASHMYRFACSRRGAAHLSQSFYFSIWPLFSSSRAAGGCHWFKDTPAADEGWACFSFAFLTQIFPDTLCGLKAPSSCCSLFAMMQLLWKRSVWQLIWRFLLLSLDVCCSFPCWSLLYQQHSTSLPL